MESKQTASVIKMFSYLNFVTSPPIYKKTFLKEILLQQRKYNLSHFIA